MDNKKYWQSFGELTNSAAHEKNAQDEFREELPSPSFDDKGLSDAKTPRRDFLKYLGFSTAAATLAASCETPVKKAIPYLNKPADIVPGVADYYATTYVSGGDAVSVIAKVRDGRPVKLEGNELSTITKGSTSARVQASVLDLYDTARLRHPLSDGKEVTTFDAFDKMVAAALAGVAGKPLVLLTGTITSPSTKQIIAEFLAKYPGSRHVQYDGVSYSGMLQANEAAYGKRAIPSYHFENAKVIVSLGADFLGTWLTPIEFQKGYTAGRKINEKNPEMSKHYQFESFLSMTGSNADERYTHKPSETGAVAAALLSAVSGQPVNVAGANLKKGIEKVAKDLIANKGKALVVSGSNDANVQLIVNAINEAIGANGTTINWAATIQTKQGIDSEFTTLVNDLNAGAVGALLVYDANPVYDYFDGAALAAAIKKTPVTISFNEKLDETTELCKYVVPSHHYLESWGDAEPKSGYFSMLQPTINPLFKTRQFQDSLLKWSGNPSTYEAYFKSYWTGKLGSTDLFEKALQDGVIEPASASVAGGAFNGGAVAAAVTAATAKKGSGKELVLYQKPSICDGKQANNPWLQEMPDPITRAVWDNYAIISPKYAKELLNIDITDRKQADDFEVNPPKPVIKITAGKKEIELPVLIIPGVNDDTIAIAVGYGRSEKVGRAVKGVGKNAYPLAVLSGNNFDWNVGSVTVATTTQKYDIATTQTHSSYEGRHEVVKEMTFEEFKKNPTEIRDERAKELKPWGGLEKYEEEGTIYPHYERPGIKWGMAIDMNACYGCGACVIACNAENNVSVVGKQQAKRYHDMHWLRIDRYFASTTGDANNADSIQTVYQPMLCQHCDNAPCENVCPVAATPHSSEGINMMTYNRCIGTRYCANNCPYKVRRFNWLDYTGADSFADNQQAMVDEGYMDDVVLMMNDDLTRMVLNPDVTVRSRGVMEKCTFCVQRCQEGKLKAKKENRVLEDSDVKTACQQACAADAIVFGNANNPNSAISQMRKNNPNRIFHVLEQLHVLPNVSYLAKIRNAEEGPVFEGHEEHKEEAHAEQAPAAH